VYPVNRAYTVFLHIRAMRLEKEISHPEAREVKVGVVFMVV
jgi:hypothetical protein